MDARRLARDGGRLGPRARGLGRGYATEGARATIDYAFDVLGWTEVIHCIEPDNASSRALAVRLGATLLRQARLPEPFDHVLLDIWGQSREQWRARCSGRR
jgi:RimJ/RimL family protein N-acetyltransferase